MKKCEKCGRKYTDKHSNCPLCDNPLSGYRTVLDAFYDMTKTQKSIIIAILLIVSFVLGFALRYAVGIKKSAYEDVIHQRDVLSASKKELVGEYNAYKEKMQPYEAQQQADVKAAEEKKAVEEQAKKEAEEKAAAEKAAQEAEAKRQEDEQAKVGTLGMTPKDFISQFNINCDNLGSNIVVTIPSKFDTFAHLTTSNNSITLDLSITKSGYVSSVFVNYKNLGNNDGISGAYAMVAAAQSVDKSTPEATFTAFFDDMLKSATYGQDYEKILNGIKYRINYEDSSFVLMIRK